ncbi:hypothetical protein ABPG74_009988 [Tetrahymena malaccensis]
MADLWVQQSIDAFLRKKIHSFIQEGPTELVTSQCKYHYCISELLWYKVRVVHTCVIKLNQNDPLYWVIKNCGIKYLQELMKKELVYQEFNQIIYVLLFNLFDSSDHLTFNGCKEKLNTRKRKILANVYQCDTKNKIDSFYQQYINSSNEPLSIKEVNSYYSIQNYKSEILKTIPD